ncbi:MAG: bifunctional phosphopantothenoylcysteine decarboxylase/phosphopantothenate--cysteine ligase CoaBC, partial [Deferribacterota bacterium]|nr:bifunctional phosphopantothenoylcysteine decarboxylase/phosphopantothenate--cysteine ligase CoaBC [Deferribacterota bacterium]
NIIPPSKGELACSDEGVGRLKEPDEIFDYVNDYIQSSKEYKGIRFLVTAGPTREYIDPVRYITNRSSGKMGLSLANVIKRKGGTVSLVTGSIDCKDIHYDRIFNVETADEMLNLLKKEVKESDILIMAAAVADFKPKEISERKIKKGKSFLLELVENPDILKELSKEKDESQVFVGFAAESDDLIENAKKKIGEKNLDMIVLNDISRSDIGFDSNYNEVTLIYKNGRMKRVPKATKEKIAEEIISKAVEIYKSING